MLIKIPTLKKEYIDGEVVRKREELEVEIDTSFLAHLKWEEQFQKTTGCSLTVYTAKMQEALKDEVKAKAHFVSLLKLLYCYVNSDKLPTFREFCSLFDYEIADEILNKIAVVFEEVNKSVVSKKN